MPSKCCVRLAAHQLAGCDDRVDSPTKPARYQHSHLPGHNPTEQMQWAPRSWRRQACMAASLDLWKKMLTSDRRETVERSDWGINFLFVCCLQTARNQTATQSTYFICTPIGNVFPSPSANLSQRRNHYPVRPMPFQFARPLVSYRINPFKRIRSH